MLLAIIYWYLGGEYLNLFHFDEVLQEGAVSESVRISNNKILSIMNIKHDHILTVPSRERFLVETFLTDRRKNHIPLYTQNLKINIKKKSLVLYSCHIYIKCIYVEHFNVYLTDWFNERR